jgi:hypothetical protein
MLKPLGSEYYFVLFPCQIPQFTTPKTRLLPVDIPFPINKTDTLTYNMPTGFELKNKPDSVTVNSPYGKYALKFGKQNRQLIAVRHFELFPAKYSKQQYPEFYKFIKTVSEIDRKNITIKRTN